MEENKLTFLPDSSAGGDRNEEISVQYFPFEVEPTFPLPQAGAALCPLLSVERAESRLSPR